MCRTANFKNITVHNICRTANFKNITVRFINKTVHNICRTANYICKMAILKTKKREQNAVFSPLLSTQEFRSIGSG